MKQPELTPEENAILLDFIWDCFEKNLGIKVGWNYIIML